MKALIKVGYGCNENCTFCHTQDVRHIDAPSAEIEAKIDRAAALGHTMVVLSGGEATIRSELMSWATRVARKGLDFGLVTNGLVLSYPAVVDRLIALRLRYVYMSLHGGEARVHNRLVRSRSFERVIAAIDNLSGRGLDLTINCVVTRHNVEHLLGLVDAVVPYPDLTLKFSAVEPKGGAKHLLEQVVPRIEVAAARVRQAIAHGDAKAGPQGPRFTHGGFPLCLMAPYEDRFDDLRTDEFATMVEVGEPDFFPVDDLNKIQPPGTCGDCSLRGPCPGLFATYYERYGAEALRPVEGKPRSNSFDWVYEAQVPSAGDACPLWVDGPSPWDRGRHLFVRHDGKIGRFRATTRDFSDVEIGTIKHGRGQVYLDASSKVAPDDFAADLVALRRSDQCTQCPAQPSCTGLFEPVFEDGFTRDDEAVRELLATLRGDVLDVGCGEGRYADVFASAIAAGTITYHGLDPDSDRLQRLRAKLPGATLQCRPLPETLDATFDHVLVLRSWNHLPDPEAAAEALRRCVRPGGTLTVVDNVAFGLARTPRQTRRARDSHAQLEHFRNDDAQAAHRWLASPHFALRLRRDVGPTTSNQWILSYVFEVASAQ